MKVLNFLCIPVLLLSLCVKSSWCSEVTDAAQGFRRHHYLEDAKFEKRQIYREAVLPVLGGVIPSSALSPQRLRHNAQDAVGIEAPDGLVYQPRETDIRPGLRDPEDQEEILTLTARKHPQQPTDFNGMMAPEPQPTTYLLRRPSELASLGPQGAIGRLVPSVAHGDHYSGHEHDEKNSYHSLLNRPPRIIPYGAATRSTFSENNRYFSGNTNYPRNFGIFHPNTNTFNSFTSNYQVPTTFPYYPIELWKRKYPVILIS